MVDLLELQFRIAELARDFEGAPGIPVQFGIPTTLSWLMTQFGGSARETRAAIDRMAETGRMRVFVWPRGRDRPLEFVPGRDDIRRFVGDEVRLACTPAGMEWVDTERRRRAALQARTFGDATTDDVIRLRLEEALRGREVTVDRRRVIEGVLGRLTWIGAQNYRSPEFLTARALRELERDRASGVRAAFERTFYQPFLHAEFMRDDVISVHVRKGVEQAGGVCDFLVGDLPVEAKVIYPDDPPATVERRAIVQTAQYAAQSGIGFLAMLDMHPRGTAPDLGLLMNDVRVLDVPLSDGPATIRVIRVLHVVGYGPPSRVRG